MGMAMNISTASQPVSMKNFKPVRLYKGKREQYFLQRWNELLDAGAIDDFVQALNSISHCTSNECDIEGLQSSTTWCLRLFLKISSYYPNRRMKPSEEISRLFRDIVGTYVMESSGMVNFIIDDVVEANLEDSLHLIQSTKAKSEK